VSLGYNIEKRCRCGRSVIGVGLNIGSATLGERSRNAPMHTYARDGFPHKKLIGRWPFGAYSKKGCRLQGIKFVAQAGAGEVRAQT
jgi:hypothetical protein